MKPKSSKNKKTATKAASTGPYAIEKILDSRVDKNSRPEYLIRWKNYPESEQSWQSVDDLFSTKKSQSKPMTMKLQVVKLEDMQNATIQRPTTTSRQSNGFESSDVSRQKNDLFRMCLNIKAI